MGEARWRMRWIASAGRGRPVEGSIVSILAGCLFGRIMGFGSFLLCLVFGDV